MDARSRRIGNVGSGARIAQGDNITWIEANEVPRALYQLPPDIGDFTDREEILAELVSVASGAVAEEHGCVVTIAGPPGVGKSALALHLAHRLTDYFPDAQLYVDLLGPDRQSLETTEALAGFLRALGVSADVVPALEAERAALFRATLAGKSAIVLIDNARSEEQVRPLRPADRSCVALVTSRVPLTGLEGAGVYELDVFTAQRAIELVGAITGDDRVSSDPLQAEELVRLCGYLPLALRIVAARLKGRRDWSVEKLVDRLSDERKRLGELKLRDLDVRAAIALTYNELPGREAELFRLLSLLGGADFGIGIAMSLMNMPMLETEQLMDRLEELQLLEVAGDDRYRFHDLIRLFAAERLASDQQPNDTKQALERALTWYLDRAKSLRLILTRPGVTNDHYQTALAWGELERKALVAIVERARLEGLWQYVIDIADSLLNFMTLRSYWSDWETLAKMALDAARQVDDRGAEARALGDLGNVYRELGRLDDAVACHEQDVAICREIKDRHGEGQALNNLGMAFRDQGNTGEALSRLALDLEICRELNYRRGEGQALTNVASVLLDCGEWDQGIEYGSQSLAILREVGDRNGEALALTNLGAAYRQKGLWSEALSSHQESLKIRRQTGDRRGQGVALNNLGNVYSALKRWKDAIDCYQENLDLRRQLGDRRGVGIALTNLGSAYGAQELWAKAIDLWEQSIPITQQFGDRRSEVTIHTNLGIAYTATGETEMAQAHWHAAETLIQEIERLDPER